MGRRTSCLSCVDGATPTCLHEAMAVLDRLKATQASSRLDRLLQLVTQHDAAYRGQELRIDDLQRRMERFMLEFHTRAEVTPHAATHLGSKNAQSLKSSHKIDASIATRLVNAHA